MRWQRELYQIAVAHKGHGFTETINGATYRGLGLSGYGNWWTLTHLGSGHRLVVFECPAPTAFKLATELAERFEWDWTGLHGWRNVDAELKEKFALWMAANRAHARRPVGEKHEETAKRIGVARW